MIRHTDVVIVGSGAAGTAAALTLTRLGASVLIVDRSTARPTLGEGLPPSAMPVLRDLGLWERLLADRHRAAFGNRSVWGSSNVAEYDFIRTPYGLGWHLDRPRFDLMLTDVLVKSSAVVQRQTRVLACRRVQAGAWVFSLASNERRWEVHTDFVIDASGRARQLTRSQRVQRRVYDRLVGMVGVLVPTMAQTDRDSCTSVEAVRDGWWYATLLPDSRLAVGFMTDADIAAATKARTVAGWQSLLAQTVHIRDRVWRHGYQLAHSIRPVCADSSCLQTMIGDGWCAVGDAAVAYDPLSSQGITSALLSGVWAGQAIAMGSTSGLAAYEHQMQHVYARYLANWMWYYAMEQRWPASPFWRRRHSVLERLPAP